MTDIERAQVMKMQREGLGYKRIATVLSLPLNTVKTFCRRNARNVRMRWSAP